MRKHSADVKHRGPFSNDESVVWWPHGLNELLTNAVSLERISPDELLG